MKVTLAYPWNDHAPDETVEVDDATGRGLISGGRARPADDAADAAPTTPRPAKARATRNRKRTKA